MATTPNPLLPTLTPGAPVPAVPGMPPANPGVSSSSMGSMASLGAAQANASANPFSNIGKSKGGAIGSYSGM